MSTARALADSELLTYEQAALRLGVTIYTVRYAVRMGTLTPVLVGNKKYLRPADVDTYNARKGRRAGQLQRAEVARLTEAEAEAQARTIEQARELRQIVLDPLAQSFERKQEADAEYFRAFNQVARTLLASLNGANLKALAG